MKWKSFVLTVAMGVLLFPHQFAFCDQAIPLPIQRLTSESQLILQGTVRSKTVQRDPAGRIYTKVELDVAEVWKGALATNKFTIVHGGGILGDMETTVSGQAEYEIGEEVIAFLIINPEGFGVSIGMDQGKFHVWPDANGEKLARNRFHGGEPAATPPPAGNLVQPPSAPIGRLPVTDLKRRVKEAGQ